VVSSSLKDEIATGIPEEQGTSRLGMIRMRCVAVDGAPISKISGHKRRFVFKKDATFGERQKVSIYKRAPPL
jgi:hypothetical protein